MSAPAWCEIIPGWKHRRPHDSFKTQVVLTGELTARNLLLKSANVWVHVSVWALRKGGGGREELTSIEKKKKKAPIVKNQQEA